MFPTWLKCSKRRGRWWSTDWIDEAAFREFTFTNPARFYTGTNPAFFKGTVVEAAVDGFLAEG